MATIQQNERQPQAGPTVGVNFQMPEALKVRLDIEVARNLRTTLRDFCIAAITEKLDREASRRTGKSGAK